MAALHVQAQVLLVLGGEVTELTSERLPSCRAQEGESGRRSPGDGRESRQTLTVSGRREGAGHQSNSFSHLCA